MAAVCDVCGKGPGFGKSVSHSELLPFLREQAVSITNHRFGTPLDLAADLL